MYYILYIENVKVFGFATCCSEVHRVLFKSMNDIRKDIEFSAELKGKNLKFFSTWGLFSPEGIDEGTRLLIEELEISEDTTSLDLGCGYGAIGLVMARLAPK